MKIFNRKTFSLLAAFALGGFATFLIQNHLPIKTVEAAPVKKDDPQVKITHNDKRADPFARMRQFEQQMQKQMDQAFNSSFFQGNAFAGMDDESAVKVNEHEDAKYKYVEVAANGVDKNSLNINISNGMISISGEVKEETQKNGSTSNFMSKFSRSFNVPYGVDDQKVQIDNSKDKIVLKFPKVNS